MDQLAALNLPVAAAYGPRKRDQPMRYNGVVPTDDERAYDLAVSFASEHREYVERTVQACVNLGLSVFYDRDKSNEWWGKSFIREQRKIYSSQTRYFVPFLSTEYLAKPIPMDEFSSAMMTAVSKETDMSCPSLSVTYRFRQTCSIPTFIT